MSSISCLAFDMIGQLKYRKIRSEAQSRATATRIQMTVSRQMLYDLERFAKAFCLISLPIITLAAILTWESHERQTLELATSVLKEPENRFAPVLKIWAAEVLGRKLAPNDDRIRKALDPHGDSSSADQVLFAGAAIGGAIGLSPDGKLIATGHSDGTARVWEIPDAGKSPLVLRGHSRAVTSVAFSSDGHEILTGSFDRSARLWNVATGDTLIELHEPRGAVIGVGFSPGDGSIVTRSSDGTIQTWSRDGRRLSVFTIPE